MGEHLHSCSAAVAQCMVSGGVGLRGLHLAGLCGGGTSVSVAGWEGACWSQMALLTHLAMGGCGRITPVLLHLALSFRLAQICAWSSSVSGFVNHFPVAVSNI